MKHSIMTFGLFAALTVAPIASAFAEEPATPATPTTTTPPTIATKAYVDDLARKRAKPSDITAAIAAQKGVADGVATLGADGKVPNEQLPGMQNGDDYLLKAGGTMTGAITLLGAPSEDLHAATKKYVDDIAAQGGGGLNGSFPGWEVLETATYGPHWGDTWEVMTADNSHKIEGVAACLGENSDSQVPPTNGPYLSNKLPLWSGWGRNCYCRVSRVNDERVLGAWVFYETYPTHTDCYSACATNCGLCVRIGTYHSCSRSALFAAP
jgi:hypothetical protein